MDKFSNIEKKYLGKKFFLSQKLYLSSIYSTIVQNKHLYLNFYNKRFFVKPRSQSPICLRQIRRNIGFPIRGQRTSSNGKTAKKRL